MNKDRFADSFAEGFKEEKQILYSMDHEDKVISKIAGIDIFQPTIDNIEAFIKKYTLGEISFYPRTVNIGINLIPTAFNTQKIKGVETIKDAHGVVTLKLFGAKIELPFIIRDSEFMPFDIIQMKEDRIPYSRENLGKIFMAIERIAKNPDALNEHNPFVGLDDAVTEITDPGFLGNTLRIREQAYERRGVNRGEIVVSAAEKIDELLEKTANIKPLHKQDFEKIEKLLIDKYAKEFIDEMEKIANEDISTMQSHIKDVFQELKELQFEDVNSMPNGTKIVFPEKKGSEINMVNAIVLREVITPKYDRGKKLLVQEPNSILIITEDGRFKKLRDRSKFYGIKKDGDWALKATPISTMKEGKVYTSILGNKVVTPFIVSHADNVFDGPDGEPVNNGIPRPFNFDCVIFPAGGSFKIAQVPNLRFESTTAQKAGEIYADSIRPETLPHVTGVLPYEFFGCDKDLGVIELKGGIEDYLVNPKDIVFTESDDEILKSASDNGEIKIILRDKEREKFDLHIRWKKDDGKLFSTERREFLNIHAGKVTGILKAAGLEYSQILTLIERAKKDNQVNIPMPQNATPEKISGGYVENKVKATLDNIKKNMFGKDVAELAASEILGSQLASAALSFGPKALHIIDVLNRYASESEALAVKFEKAAQEYNNENLLKVAKLMVAQHRIENAMISAIRNNEKLAFVNESLDLVRELRPELEKVAYDLIKLKAQQYENRNELISPCVIGAAVKSLDRMYKIAMGTVSLKDESVKCVPHGPLEEKKKDEKEIDPNKEDNKEEKTVEDEVVDKE